MTARESFRELAWLPIVLAALLVIYLPGLDNALVYDDSYLTSGLFDDYQSLALRVRMLSYGSFVWLHALVGDGWWKQRLANLAIHVAVVVALWALYRQILARIVPPSEPGEEPVSLARSPALGVAIGFFALNPVAVYAVAYLIQRSILLATLFVVLGLWLFAVAVNRDRPGLHAAALACYGAAVLSKEYAVLAPLAALPVYIVLARPGARRIAVVCAAALVAVVAAALALSLRYEGLLFKPFDEYSQVFMAQLDQLAPGTSRHAWALSAMNEGWLFFRYGFDWLVPWQGWLSINLRPPFPLRWLSFPQLPGALAYLGVLLGGFYLVVRYRDWRALLGLSVLLPALLFGTEFATVWVQDPFVLYRSYLWAIGMPGLVFLAVHGPSWRVLLAVAAVVVPLLVWQGLDRVSSLRNPETVWTDAIGKLPNDPRAVGRWFAYLNRGSAYVDSDNFGLAMEDFRASAVLGDEGMGSYNLGVILSTRGRYQEALDAFARAERDGYRLYNLPLQRGLVLMQLGRLREARQQLEAALAMDPPPQARTLALLKLARAAVQLGDPGVTIAAMRQLLDRDPNNLEGRYLLGMAYAMTGHAAEAREILDKLIAEHPSGPARYARALANYRLGRKAEALADIDAALHEAPTNANLRQWRAKILAMP
ncbi:MAG TPA: tetratricopeptide repeat protein [Usitatibacter sp.]|nr:tetratricopeptide repeat protein [Usitatibacter sp.]